ncbi:leucine-rich repeat-containing protein 14-like isoform X3 [Nycticebus coucang]|uniref:leucine-rich repeat-containing protein 14-like isoform X3 n=1 Tax=Nycticebus coucang TaxID=9470 RepID=UPI00234CD570|nr:leucine-rich repeat-containing protein 14-like isoform X3 [Nycticebus coucang]
MSNPAPPKLLELAAHSLLSNEASALPALEEFTIDLFPPLLTAAFARGHKKALKALVQAWPFPFLRLGSLIVQWPNQDSLQAVLDGLGNSSAPSACPSLLTKVERSHGSLRLCCRKLHIEEMPFNSLIGILKTLELDFIQELEVFDWFRALSEQSLFATQLGRICNLRSLKLAYYHWTFPPEGEQSSSCFLSQLSKLGHLQKLHLSYSYLSGNLHQVLRCLQAPLHALEIRSCTLLDTDITYLSQSLHATCLRKLDLSGNNLSYMVPGPLETLLAKISGTLQHLDLNHCRLKDSHLSAILPALCLCSHLGSLGLSDNPVSRAGLLSLLEHTAGLMELKRVLYPIPIECCMYLHGLSWGPVNKGRLCQVQAEMQRLLQAVQRADMQWSPPLPSPLPVRLVQLD